MGKVPFVITNFSTGQATEKEIETVSTRVATEVSQQEIAIKLKEELEKGKRDDTKIVKTFSDISDKEGIFDVLYVAEDTGAIYMYKGIDEEGKFIYEEVSKTEELSTDDIEKLFNN